ncbi:YbjN domain-containing protein [Desulfovibrio sp. OttesenSCG-928-A18]|nr:YbjN domain-containing protein [Desulfovibrio sp. OttesenSCG-928-A18]
MKLTRLKLAFIVCLGVLFMHLQPVQSFAATSGGDDMSIVTAEDPNVLLDVAKGFGSAELSKLDNGTPIIYGRVDGIKYGVYFYGCDSKGEKCKTIQFAASWETKKFTIDDVNTWNKDKRFGKVYLDREGEPVIEFDVNLTFGVTRKNLDDTFDWWMNVVKSFAKVVSEKSAPTPPAS